jgi:hypothetical protein
LLLEQLNLTGGLINQRAERGRGPNSIVEPDPARNFLHIRTDALAKIGYFVDEGDLGGQGGWCRGSERRLRARIRDSTQRQSPHRA